MTANNIITHENLKLGEKYKEIRHESGLRILVNEKSFSNTVAMLTVKFGAADRTYRNVNEALVCLPAGTAHFLEHKMFETESGEDVFYIFSKYGAYSNAFTSNDITSYYFSCTENFYESLDILLDFIFEPHFTPESVEKEKDIIRQEIRASEDSPKNRIYYELIRSLYNSRRVCDTVSGSEEDIDSIDYDLLRRCQRDFYTPDNMVLTVCGNVSVKRIIDAVDRHMKDRGDARKILRIHDSVDPFPDNMISEVAMDVSRPMFAFGIRDNVTEYDERERTKRMIAAKIVLDIAFGHSGEFFSDLYEKGILTNNFSADYERLPERAFVMVNGAADDPFLVLDHFRDKINELANGGISTEDFARMKRSSYADYVTGFDSADMIAEDLIESAITNVGLFEIYDIMLEIDHEYVCRIAREIFSDAKVACAIVRPIEP